MRPGRRRPGTATSGWSVPLLECRLGAGLGNEALAWGKAFVAAQELDLRLARPLNVLSRHAYARAFGWQPSRLLAERARSLAGSRVVVTAEMVRSTGCSDYGEAIRALSEQADWGRHHRLVLCHQGMSGGYLGIRRARYFLAGQVMSAPGVAGDLYRMRLPASEPVVAVHVRQGDFLDATDAALQGRFNTRLPADWYRAVVAGVRRRMPDARILVLSDDAAAAGRLFQGQNVELISEWSRGLLSDLAVMALADLLVCSLSSFSMLAAFLSDGHYAWFGPQLQTHPGGLASIWGHEADQRQAGSPTLTAVEAAVGGGLGPGRAWAIDRDGAVDGELLERVQERARMRGEHHDLLTYGVVPYGS